MFHRLINYLNKKDFFPYYICTPLIYSIGNASEHIYTAAAHAKRKRKKILIFKAVLVSVLATIAILSLPILLNKDNTHFKHALEWNYFVGVILFYFLTRLFWKRTT